MRHANILAVALFVTFTCSAASVQWTWRDASGRINASDMAPPSSVPEKDILQRPTDQHKRAGTSAVAPGAAASTAVQGVQDKSAARGTDPELEARRKHAADERAAQSQQEKDHLAKARADNCTRARSQLAALSDGQRLSRANAQGEAIILDDRARAEETERTRAVIASDCN
jgi:hypothetical protein